MPFGKLPVLEEDGKRIPQSVAIARYMASKAGLAGKDAWENLQTDSGDIVVVVTAMPFGKLPVLEKDGKRIPQSVAIARYLASKAGLAGKDAWENLQTDSGDIVVVVTAMPFGKLPVLEEDGKRIPQSVAIARYLASKAGLAGKDAWENLQTDSGDIVVVVTAMPFGKLPVLEKDGKRIPQSVAIARYLASKAGLAGKDAWENLQTDSGDIVVVVTAMPFGKLPVLEEDGKCIPQSVAIARYLASKAGLAGKDAWENLQTDSGDIVVVVTAMPFGKLPVLEEDGKRIPQSVAIARYLASKAGLAGKDAWENLQTDSGDIVVVVTAMPFGKLPVLEKDGKRIPQSVAIARYLASKAGLAGKDAWENLQTDSGDIVVVVTAMPFGKLPVLEKDGKRIPQSVAIARYLASKAGLAGKDAWENLQTDSGDIVVVVTAMPFGKLPVLEEDGKRIPQSVAIARYLASKAGLAGKDAWENLQIDYIADTLQDVKTPIYAAWQEKDEQKKKTDTETYIKETLPFYFKKLDDIVKENGGYLANKKLSWVDFLFTTMTDFLNFTTGLADVTADYPHLHRLKQTVLGLPGVQQWVARRPQTDF